MSKSCKITARLNLFKTPANNSSGRKEFNELISKFPEHVRDQNRLDIDWIKRSVREDMQIQDTTNLIIQFCDYFLKMSAWRTLLCPNEDDFAKFIDRYKSASVRRQMEKAVNDVLSQWQQLVTSQEEDPRTLDDIFYSHMLPVLLEYKKELTRPSKSPKKTKSETPADELQESAGVDSDGPIESQIDSTLKPKKAAPKNTKTSKGKAKQAGLKQTKQGIAIINPEPGNSVDDEEEFQEDTKRSKEVNIDNNNNRLLRENISEIAQQNKEINNEFISEDARDLQRLNNALTPKRNQRAFNPRKRSPERDIEQLDDSYRKRSKKSERSVSEKGSKSSKSSSRSNQKEEERILLLPQVPANYFGAIETDKLENIVANIFDPATEEQSQKQKTQINDEKLKVFKKLQEANNNASNIHFQINTLKLRSDAAVREILVKTQCKISDLLTNLTGIHKQRQSLIQKLKSTRNLYMPLQELKFVDPLSTLEEGDPANLILPKHKACMEKWIDKINGVNESNQEQE